MQHQARNRTGNTRWPTAVHVALLLLFGGLADRTPVGDTWTRSPLPIGWRRLEVRGPAPRNVHGMTYDLRRERVVLFGGIGEEGRLDDLWEWDGAAWTAIPHPADAASSDP